jgi:hypothetical protein
MVILYISLSKNLQRNGATQIDLLQRLAIDFQFICSKQYKTIKYVKNKI